MCALMPRKKSNREKRERGENAVPFSTLTKLLGHGDKLGGPLEVGNVCQGDAPLERGRPEMNCVTVGGCEGRGKGEVRNENGLEQRRLL